MRGVRILFGRGGIGPAQDIPGKFHHGHLHAQADAKERDFVFPGKADGADFPLQAAGAKAGGHQNAIRAGEFFRNIFRGNVVGLNREHVYFAAVGRSGMDEALLDALVGILKLHVFPHQGNVHFRLRVRQLVQEAFQLAQIRRREIRYFQFIHDHFVQMLRLHVKGNLVNAPGIHGLDDVAGLHVAEKGNLAPEFRRQLLFCTADNDIRMHAL